MNLGLEDLAELDPYGMPAAEKDALLRRRLGALTAHHSEKCPQYRRILEGLGFDPKVEHDVADIPPLPVRLFKDYELLSCDRSEVAKAMTSSGTSGQAVSKVFLDKRNVRDQTRVLTQILSSFIGRKRLPLILLDTEMVKTDRSMFSARGAGIIGFTMFGRQVIYALDDRMEMDLAKVRDFVQAQKGSTILLFGYTSLIWEHVVERLRRAGICLDIEDGILFHIGGWKKLKDRQVDVATYNAGLREVLGNLRIYNYYGMAEQLGSVFVECEEGHMHCSIYSDVLLRRPEDLAPVAVGETGLIELVSLLPTSYPGHVLLTEDEGSLLGQDDCPCGRLGRYFRIHGRMKGAEIRGCSDTYERR